MKIITEGASEAEAGLSAAEMQLGLRAPPSACLSKFGGCKRYQCYSDRISDTNII